MTFDMLPNKIKSKQSKTAPSLWPECGDSFELNEFYRLYSSCGGEIGGAFIFFWSAEEIADYEPFRADIYPDTWRIFGSDGGGTYFGFSNNEGKIHFFSCDPIDPRGSVTWLGRWPDFIRLVSKAKYVCFKDDGLQNGS